MAGSKRSRTAQGVLAERAILTDMGVLDDPIARSMLSPSMAALYRLCRRRPQRVPTLPVTLAGLAARVLWHDAQVFAALDGGLDQVAVIGAGYDTRAWRFRRAGVRFFELDHAPTQADKARRAPGSGPTYVEVDLTTQSAAETLRDGGFDPSRPALFVLEGLTMYLSEDVVRGQLRDLSQMSAARSRLTTDFYPPGAAGAARDQRQHRLQRLARAGSGEDLHLLVDRSQAAALVDGSGWTVDEAVSMRATAHRLVPAACGLPVDAVDEHKTLVSASR